MNDDFGAGVPHPDRLVVLGRIAGAFGVKGWVKVSSYTEPADNILNYRTWQLHKSGAWEAIEVEASRVTDKGVLAKLVGIESPEEARLYVGLDVGIARSQLPPPAPGEYYWSDLEGLMACSASGEELGRIDHFRATPGGTIVVVRGEREHWIPFVKQRILKIDLDAGRVVLDWSSDW